MFTCQERAGAGRRHQTCDPWEDDGTGLRGSLLGEGNWAARWHLPLGGRGEGDTVPNLSALLSILLSPPPRHLMITKDSRPVFLARAVLPSFLPPVFCSIPLPSSSPT